MTFLCKVFYFTLCLVVKINHFTVLVPQGFYHLSMASVRRTPPVTGRSPAPAPEYRHLKPGIRYSGKPSADPGGAFSSAPSTRGRSAWVSHGFCQQHCLSPAPDEIRGCSVSSISRSLPRSSAGSSARMWVIRASDLLLSCRVQRSLMVFAGGRIRTRSPRSPALLHTPRHVATPSAPAPVGIR